MIKEFRYQTDYNRIMIKRDKSTDQSRSVYDVITAVALLLGELLKSVASLLASSTKTSDASDTSDVAPSGGIFNYRTAELDDGTDPVGWYEED